MELYRAFIYRFLSVAFDEPTEESLEALRGGLDDLSLCLSKIGMDFDVKKLERLLETFREEENLLELKGEWNALLGVGLKAPMWETAYEIEKAGRKSHELSDIEGFYRAFGFEVKQGYEPDGLIAQLEFLALLLLKINYAKDMGLKEEEKLTEKAYRDFFRDHLGRWYRLFCELINEYAEVEYYKVLGQLFFSFLELERKEVPDIVDIERYVMETLQGSSWECGITGRRPLNPEAPEP